MTPFPPPLRAIISLGDPGGIGPEIVARVASDQALWDRVEALPVLVGPTEFLARQFQRLGIEPVSGTTMVPPDGWPDSADLVTGLVDGDNGRAALASLRRAHELVAAQPDSAILVTAPISKEAIHLAGCAHPGHTELLADWCGLDPSADVRMMLAIPGLRVILHTIHIPLAAVRNAITTEALMRTFELTDDWCRDNGLVGARVAVCGLNPHAGENGHIGREELDIISPALEMARLHRPATRWSGPHSADTLFARALAREFDVVLALYHDQGLIPVKTLDMHRGVNHTMGLPYIRTSPDHGTAFEIAGRGEANPGSMAAAVEFGMELLHHRRDRKLLHSAGIGFQP
jgi:4-hydroxythreonine-4-phosphate dehydrogenase